MARKNKSASAVRTSFLMCIAICSGASHQFALAQQDAPQAATTLPPVEVVGSRVKRSDWETPTPVQVITEEEIRNSGATSMRELLKHLATATSIGATEDMIPGQFSGGASSVSLRGLGASATLILLNGRRIASSPYMDPNPGVSQIYNLNVIPLSAIERIEVLKGGASAIYGSDAVGGVINIVMRQSYRGAEAGLTYSFDENGKFGNRRLHGMVGFGDAGPDGQGRYSGYLLFSNTKRDATTVGEARGVPESEYTRLFNRNTPAVNTASYPPNYFRETSPGSGAFTTFVARDARCPSNLVLTSGLCGFNSDRDLPIVTPSDINSIMGRVDVPVAGNLALFAEFGLARVDSVDAFSPQSVLQTGTFWFAEDGRRNFFRWVLPTGHPDNPTTTPVALRYSFVDVGQRRFERTIDTSRIVLGAKGLAAGWDWESAFVYNNIDQDLTYRGFLSFSALQDAINTQAYRPFGNNSPQTLASISPPFAESASSRLMSLDLKGSRKLMNMAGGPMALAAGAELRKEELKVTANQRILDGDLFSLGASRADGSRQVRALFAELSTPFAKSIESQVAVRSDFYSDFGNSTTPQLGIKWKPIESLAFRGSYAKGFRVPSLSQSSNSNITLFSAGAADPLRCGRPGATPDDCSIVVSSLIRSNPDLDPEKSTSRTIGLVFSPTADFDVALDYYHVDRKDETGLLVTQFILQNEARLPNTVIRDPNPATWLPGVPNSGPITSILRRYDTRTSAARLPAASTSNPICVRHSVPGARSKRNLSERTYETTRAGPLPAIRLSRRKARSLLSVRCRTSRACFQRHGSIRVLHSPGG